MLLTSTVHIGHLLLQQAQSLLPVCQQLSPASSKLFKHLYMQLSPQRSHWSWPSNSSIMSTPQQCSMPPYSSRSFSSSIVQSQQQPQQQDEPVKQPGQPQQPSILYVLPMPSLSHTMTSGRITKWLKAPGDSVSIYDIVAEVTTDNLVEEAYRLDDFAGSVTLLIESQEEARLAAVLVPEGQEVPIGTPIAVLCEDEDAAAAAADAAQQVAGMNVYDEEQMQQKQRQGWQLLEWQSYLKESSKDSDGSSCGCM